MFPLHSSASEVRATRATGCPLRESGVTLDALLAEIGSSGGVALDLALDLRSALQARSDAGMCAELALRLKRVLGERHYLAMYRVRVWLVQALAIEVRAHRGDDWTRYSLPLHSRFSHGEQLEHECVMRWVQDRSGRQAANAQLRYVFAAGAAIANGTR